MSQLDICQTRLQPKPSGKTGNPVARAIHAKPSFIPCRGPRGPSGVMTIRPPSNNRPNSSRRARAPPRLVEPRTVSQEKARRIGSINDPSRLGETSTLIRFLVWLDMPISIRPCHSEYKHPSAAKASSRWEAPKTSECQLELSTLSAGIAQIGAKRRPIGRANRFNRRPKLGFGGRLFSGGSVTDKISSDLRGRGAWRKGRAVGPF